MTTPFQDLKAKALTQTALSAEEAELAFTEILNGTVDPIDITAFLIALKLRGETPDEILGAARVLRRSIDHSLAPEGAIDTCGTGGDGPNTLNISTAAALVLAAGGVPIAKHGNRSVSSQSGSTDVLGELGIAAAISRSAIRGAVDQFGITYLNAPTFHRAMATVAPIRKQLATRTIFNLLGPLSNPAGVKRQLSGTYDQRWCRPMAEVLRAEGSERAWIVHGAHGEDEISLAGKTHVVELDKGSLSTFEVIPEDVGITRKPLAAIAGGDAAFNAAAMRAVLGGEHNAYHDAVVLNAGAGFFIAEKADTFSEGADLARSVLTSGKALPLLEAWAAYTQEHAL